MRIARLWICLTVVSAGLCYAPIAVHAQSTVAPAGDPNAPWNKGVTEERREAARAVFLEGNRLFLIPLFAQAAEKYTEAIDIWKHPAFYFNLSLAQLNLGLDVEAHENLELAIRPGVGPLNEEELKEAKRQLQEVERRLARVRIACPTPGAEITLDGATLFTGPGSRETWVKAQAHEITAKRPAYITKVKRVTVAPGSLQTIELPLRKLVEEHPWAAWKPWSVVGAGVGVAAAGGVVHALSRRDFRAYDSGFVGLSCADKGCTEQDIDEMKPSLSTKLHRAQLEQKVAIGGYVAGGAVIALGAVLVYLNRPRLAQEQEAAGPRGPGIAFVPVVSGDSLGVLMTVSH